MNPLHQSAGTSDIFARSSAAALAPGDEDMFVDDFGDRTDRCDFRVAIEVGTRRVNSEKAKIKRARASGIQLQPGDAGYRAPPPGLYSSPFSDLATYPNRVVLATTYPYRYNYSLLCSPVRAIEYLRQRSPAAATGFYYIEIDRPVRAYFDIERPVSALPQMPGGPEQFVSACRLVVAFFCCYVDALFGCDTRNHYDCEWFFYSSCTATKFSLHAHSGLTFQSVKELGSVVSRFVELLTELHGQNDPLVSSLFYTDEKTGLSKPMIDAAVYTPRPFRLPLCEKERGAGNFLMPLEADDVRRGFKMTDEQHMAMGFIHPAVSIHPTADSYPMMPRDPGELRKTLLNGLLALPSWPVENIYDLDRAVRNAVFACQGMVIADTNINPESNPFNVPTEEQLNDEDLYPEGVWQLIYRHEIPALVEFGLLRATASQGSEAASGATAFALQARRERFLTSVAALISMLMQTSSHRRADSIPPETLRLMRTAVHSSLATIPYQSTREDRVRSLAKGTFNITITPTTATTTTTNTTTTTTTTKTLSNDHYGPSSDLFREFAFCSFYLRSVVYYRDVYSRRTWPSVSKDKDNDDNNKISGQKHSITRRRQLLLLKKAITFRDSNEDVRAASVAESIALATFLANGIEEGGEQQEEEEEEKEEQEIGKENKEEVEKEKRKGKKSASTAGDDEDSTDDKEKDNKKGTDLLRQDNVSRLYAQFERLVPRLFSIPDCLLSLSQLARISERDPLKDPATRPVPALNAAIAAAMPNLQFSNRPTTITSMPRPSSVLPLPTMRGSAPSLSRSGSGSGSMGSYSPLHRSGSYSPMSLCMSRHSSSSPVPPAPLILPPALTNLISGMGELQIESEEDESAFFYNKL